MEAQQKAAKVDSEDSGGGGTLFWLDPMYMLMASNQLFTEVITDDVLFKNTNADADSLLNYRCSISYDTTSPRMESSQGWAKRRRSSGRTPSFGFFPTSPSSKSKISPREST